MEKLKEVIEQVKEYEDNNCFELKTSVVLHWLKEIENEAFAIPDVVGQSEQLVCVCNKDFDGMKNKKYCPKFCDVVEKTK